MARNYYNVYDDQGNVVKTLIAPEGGSLKTDLETGTSFYKPNKEGEEEYISMKEAKASVSVSPTDGKIIVSGPSWLTSEIINSDSFKQNYSQNKSLLSLVNAYRNDPSASIADPTTGEPIKVADAISQFTESANNYANSFAQIKWYKEQTNKQYGVDFTDTDVAIATNYQSKDGYDSKSAIYIPDWAIDNYNWSSASSWDADKRTVSAEDFYKEIYKEDFGNDTASKLQKEALEKMKEQLSKNAFVRDGGEYAQAREKELKDGAYATEVARTIQMYNILSKNKPEVGAAYNALLFTEGAVSNFFKAMGEAGENLSAFAIQVVQAPANLVSDLFGLDLDEGERAAYNFLSSIVTSPVTAPAFILGEAINFVQDGGNFEEFGKELENDVLHLLAGDGGSAFDEHSAEIKNFFDEFNSQMSQVSGAWDSGAKVGEFAYKMAENVVILNTIGGALARGTKTALGLEVAGRGAGAVRGISGGLAAFMGKALPEKAVISIISAIAAVPNVVAQGMAETLLDNKDVLNKAIASGEMTPELSDTISRNIMWNAIGELSGFGASKGGGWLIENTATGKAIANAAMKATAKGAAKSNAFKYKVFTFLNGENLQEGVSKEVGAAAEAGGRIAGSKFLGKYTTGQYKVLSESWDAISKMPIIGRMSAAQKQAIDDAYNLIDITKYGEKSIGEVAQDIEKSLSDVTKASETTESMAKTKISENIEEAYKYNKKMRTIMANLENQLDLINKGVSVKMSEINNYAKAEFEEWNTKRNNIAAAERSNTRLTFGADGVLSKEGSDYLSLKAQDNWYTAKIGKATDDGVKATVVKGWEDYQAKMQEKLAELRSVLGDNLADGYDELVYVLGRYQMKIDDYMIAHGFYTKEHAEKIRGWRNQLQDYTGRQDGYFHTARRFETDDKSMREFLKDLEQPSIVTAKNIADAPKSYVSGDIEDSFIDPSIVIYGYSRAQAAVAQGQELTRAVQAATLPVRMVKGLNGDGVAYGDAETALKMDLDKVKSNFESVVKGTKAGSVLRQSIGDALYSTHLVTNTLKDFQNFTKGLDKFDTTSVASKINKSQKEIDRLTISNGKNNNSFIPVMSENDIDALLATAKAGSIPNFDLKSMKAADFNEWYNGLTGKMKKLADKTFKNYGNRKNVTTLKKILKDDREFAYKMKKEFLTDSRNAQNITLRQSQEYSALFKEKATDILAARTGVENVVLSKEVEEMQKLYNSFNDNIMAGEKKIAEMESGKAQLQAKNPYSYESFFKNYGTLLDEASRNVLTSVKTALAKDEYFNAAVKKMVDAGVEKEAAEQYILALNLKKLSGEDISKLILDKAKKSNGDLALSIFEQNAKAGGLVTPKDVNGMKVWSSKHAKDVADLLGNSLNKKFSLLYDEAAMPMAKSGLSSYMDLDDYWKEVEGLMSDIEGKALKYNADKNVVGIDLKRRERNIIQMVDQDGTLRFYETDPLYADIINFRPSFGGESGDKLMGAITGFNSATGALFRWGTTGIDTTSYINQWFRDPINASIVGGAKPFIDLRMGGFKSKVASIMSDAFPWMRALAEDTKLGKAIFGEDVFGRNIVSEISDDVVESTFKATEDGFRSMYGQEWLDDFKNAVAKNATGGDVEALYKRALVSYNVDDTGFAALPYMGGKTEAQAYRATDGKTMGMSQVRREEFDRLLGRGMSDAERDSWIEVAGNMRKKFDDLFESTSKGSWRETFLRKSVYTTNYKNAIESGMTAQDAKIWATRYALDATTDFSRPFGYANRMIKSIPYLGAAINGQRSFFRLLTLDPAGIGSRFTFGLILPYMALLSESLSSEENREVYKNIPDYEKDESFVFVVNGSRMQIPIPQELSAFVAPFRHMVEKKADANDKGWLDLISSDVLGAMPIDLSGFADLDANELLSDDDENGIWNRINRGIEKAASSLMPPAVKAIYMLKSGRDPYTGKNIDTSYITYDEEGNPVPMDNAQYELSNLAHQAFGDVSASAWDKILKTLLGRSTLSVLGDAGSVLSGTYDPKKSLDNLAGSVAKPFDAGYDSQQENNAKREWRDAVNKLYDMRENLTNDDELSKALSIMRTADDKSSSKYQNAKRIYNSKMDEYSKSVVDAAKALKSKYPESYTQTRMAQVISLLTMPTGIGYNDTAYADELQKNSYYDAKNRAVETFLRLGAPQDYAGMNSLGRGYYDGNGKFQFKIFTPYEIEHLNSASIGSDKQIQAMVSKAIKDSGINSGDMWSGYYKATDKASRKEYKQDWNARVVTELYPIISKYGADNVLSDSNTVDLLDNFIFVDNPYKTKQYLKQIFGGE